MTRVSWLPDRCLPRLPACGRGLRGSLPGDSGGTAPDSHRLPASSSPDGKNIGMQSVDLHVERHLPSRGRSHRTVATVTCVTALGDIRSAQLSATGAWPAVLFPSWSWLCGIGDGVDLQKPSCRA
ncbi:hypothetical protein T613_00268 [Mycobacterium tuberculosis UT0097]|nr:hypothetical protein Z536_02880 [Mycobacterium tuberculosis UT0043]KBK37547.1 hypothetical protein T572_00921 [Mycobacterium tuberculosis UT0034]KBL86193.1 hypothetical protein T613_00268 [Mycobacterium tuberculosis UT0097]